MRGPRSVVVAAVTALVAAALAGCGATEQVHGPDVVVSGAAATATPAASRQRRGVRIATARIAIVTHGQASDPFWAAVRRGIDAAAQQTGVAVSYRSPNTYSVSAMIRLIDAAVADRPDGLVVSLPDPAALRPAVRRAQAAGIPVVSINSGSTAFRSLGVTVHVGQREEQAGVQSGERMARAGVRRALCVDQEAGNAGMAQRCAGFARGLRRSGGTTTVLDVPLQDPGTIQRRLSRALAGGRIDGVMALGPTVATRALSVLRSGGLAGRVKVATFDLSSDVLADVRDGRLLFAVDQQPYLQGYLPIILLAQRASRDVFPDQGLIPTGPRIVTKADAGQILADDPQGIR